MLKSPAPVRITLLGGLSLASTSRTPGGAATQRKPLALLAFLASSGRNTAVSRDRLLALLWPESDEERARNTLNQTLSSLRRDLGEDPFMGTADLRLDAAVVSCDVWDLEDAARAGDDEQVVSIYAGPFLQGVHLRGSHEFDEWADAERARLADVYARSVERLATQAEADGNWHAAVQSWRRLATADPLSSRTAQGLMRALAATGDLAGALRHGQIHEQLVHEELGIPPSRELRELMDRIRLGETPVLAEGAGSQGQRSTSPVLSTPANGSGRGTVSERAGDEDRFLRTNAPFAASPRVTATQLRVLAAVAVVVVLGGGLTLGARARGAERTTAAPASLTLDEKKVVIAPFLDATINGTRPRAPSHTGQIVADWLTQGLAKTGLVTVVPIGYLSPAVHSAETEREGRLLAVAREAGAGLLVTGAYTVAGDSVVLTARVVNVADGTILRAVGPVRAPVDAALEGAEVLRQQLLGALATVVDRRLANWSGLASQPTSFEAYQAFSDGLNAFFDRDIGPFHAPIAHFRRAHELDTTFYTPLVWALFRAGGAEYDTIRTYLLARRSRLPAWDQGLLDFFTRSTQEEGYLALRRVAEQAPQSEWLYMLAWTALRTNRPAVAVRALQRLDPDRGWIREWPSYWGALADAHHALGDYEQELADVRRGRERFPDDVNLRWMEVRALAAAARNGELERALAQLRFGSAPRSQHGALRSGVVSSARELANHGHDRLLHSFVEHILTEAGQGVIAVPAPALEKMRYDLLIAADRWDEAVVLIDAVAEQWPDEVEILRDAALAAAHRGNADEAERLAREWTARPIGRIAPGVLFDEVMANVHSILGDQERAVEYLLASGAEYRDALRLHQSPAIMRLRHIPAVAEFLERRQDDPTAVPRR